MCLIYVNQSEGWERISAPPGHVISQGLAPRARVVTRGGGGGGGSGGGGGEYSAVPPP